tara:strand:+ start:430 stop:1488 length:1059 start_codon:yes stop_codon:yes gene_type:complete
MAYTTINKSTDHFNTKLYTGTGSSNAITGVGFQPDWVWIKDIGATFSNTFTDAVRGTSKELYSNGNVAEVVYSQGVTSFDSDGFTLGTDGGVNNSGGNKVAWNWKGANGTASNSNGTITSTVSANTTAGFSIVSYTANGTTGATVGHGLSSAPELVITKDRDATGNWGVYHIGLDATSPEDKYIELNSNAGLTDFTYWNDTKPSNTVVTLGNAAANNTSGRNIIMYCFHSVTGYSKFGYYTGTGQTGANAPFIYTGFKPAFVIYKNASATYHWGLFDNKRSPYNVKDDLLFPNLSNAQSAGDGRKIDMLSNGFKVRVTSDTNDINGSGNTIIYWAFAEAPLVGTNNIPATAK